MLRVLRRSPRGHRGFLLRWTFVLATIALGILLQSEDVGAKLEEFREDDEFAEFDDLDYEAKRGEGAGGGSKDEAVKRVDDVGVDLDEDEEDEFVDEDDEEFEKVRDETDLVEIVAFQSGFNLRSLPSARPPPAAPTTTMTNLPLRTRTRRQWTTKREMISRISTMTRNSKGEIRNV